VDLRDRVVADRGLIKKIQTAIPVAQEYREKEDLRIADALLRGQLADRVTRTVLPLVEDARASAADRLDLASSRDLGGLAVEVRKAEALLRHAEQGYSGISAAYRIDAAALGRLYDLDYRLNASVEALEREAASVRTAARERDTGALQGACRRVREGLESIRTAVQERRETMAQIGVFG
jgi:hypothetical protein